MAKRVSTSANNGGILGSGIFGLFGTTIQCKSEDDSIYCNIMKLFNLLIVVFVVAFVLYYIFSIIPIGKRRNR